MYIFSHATLVIGYLVVRLGHVRVMTTGVALKPVVRTTDNISVAISAFAYCSKILIKYN